MEELDATVPDSAEAISSSIVKKVAERDGVDPRELSPPLQHVVDTDALNRLFGEETGQDLQVVFIYRDYEVTVEGPTRIHLDPLS